MAKQQTGRPADDPSEAPESGTAREPDVTEGRPADRGRKDGIAKDDPSEAPEEG
jgi:hypothetical protein